MLPLNLSNLIIAGRCVSMTHDVDKFARNMAPTALMGQAAGTLAALMSESEGYDWHNIPITILQERLEKQGVSVNLG
jgi:hypothetical protein